MFALTLIYEIVKIREWICNARYIVGDPGKAESSLGLRVARGSTKRLPHASRGCDLDEVVRSAVGIDLIVRGPVGIVSNDL